MTTEPEPAPSASLLRRRISYGGNCRGGHIPNLSRREVLDLLRLDDTALLTMHAYLTGPEARGKSCAQLAADLRGVCSYGNIKALLRLLHLLVPVRRNGNGHAIRDRAGRFVAEIDMGDVAPSRQAMIRRWVATGISPEQAKIWAEEMGASEGLT